MPWQSPTGPKLCVDLTRWVAQASVAAELGCSNKAEDTLQQPESFSRWREAPNLTDLAVLS